TEAPGIRSHLPELQFAEQFVAAIRSATLQDGRLPQDVLEQLQKPPCHTVEVDDNLRLFLDVYLALDNASRTMYDAVCAAIQRRFDLDDKVMYSHDRIKRKVTEITGIVSVMHDMCIKSCMAYTGPFAEKEECIHCKEPRYDQTILRQSNGKRKVPRLQFSTNPIGPQIQAQKRSKKGAENIHYRNKQMEQILAALDDNNGIIAEYVDVYHGRQVLDAVRSNIIRKDDTMLLFSCDGAQLFRHKTSDCWMAMWEILDLSPEHRTKKKYILPACIIPGSPGNIDSFLFPSLHHLQALHNATALDETGHGGFKVWDALQQKIIVDDPYLVFATADAPALASIGGLVGHKGKRGCRGNCPMYGRLKPGGKKYYPAHLKPTRYSMEGCAHSDVNPSQVRIQSSENYHAGLNRLLQARSKAEHAALRRELGIAKPSVLSGLSRIPSIPLCFTPDIMHFCSLNLPDLFLGLWRGTMEHDSLDNEPWDWVCLEGNNWQHHGADVAACASYIPGLFDIAPRNPAEFITSGYKAQEFQTYFYGLGPALLRCRMPQKYWRNYCKLVLAIRILHQYRIRREALLVAHRLSIGFIAEYELLYYRRMTSRLHFCRQSIHGLCHLAQEVPRVGSLALTGQWAMENMIGNLGMEIKQPSNFYANLSQRSLRRSQNNALKAILPELDPESPEFPATALRLGDGFALLQPWSAQSITVSACESMAITQYMQGQYHDDREWNNIRKCGRLQLGHGLKHITRSVFAERTKALHDIRMARNVKLEYQGRAAFGEIQYYFSAKITGSGLHGFAVVTLYSEPDPIVLRDSFHTVWLCRKRGNKGLAVVDVKDIRAIVGMI
ncbi:hypothetical protein PUNSTDRAFT_26915, partial [Punctularia strigosozonata HHB-11173 SS5]|uniref:uncharacterized protein n=1 Tax=Punctularia strigosozonata (strain HHB-11173) TaxID=741275 RepID=UPI0004417A34